MKVDDGLHNEAIFMTTLTALAVDLQGGYAIFRSDQDLQSYCCFNVNTILIKLFEGVPMYFPCFSIILPPANKHEIMTQKRKRKIHLPTGI